MKKTIIVSLLLIFATVFIRTNILHSQWTHINTLSGLGTYSVVSVPSPDVVFIAGGLTSPVIYRSTNSGINFSAIPTSGMSTQFELYSLWCVDANTIYAGDGGSLGGGGGNAHVFKTTNAGINWTTILSTGGLYGFINGIVFSKVNSQVGVIESDPPGGFGTAYWWQLTTNGGNTWTQKNGPALGSNYASQNYSVFCIDANFFGVGTSQYNPPKVILTSNSGTNWLSPILSLPSFYVFAVAFSTDKTNGMAATYNSFPNFGRTTDGGLNWININIGGELGGIPSIKWVPGTNVIYIMGSEGSSGSCRRSTNGGATWTQMTTGSIEGITHMELIYVSGTVYAYAISAAGAVIKLVDVITNIKLNDKKIPHSYYLQQNYPNPFNPSTNMTFDLPKSGDVKLTVFDVLGREVLTLINEKLNAGTYEIEWDGSNYPSGVYFYKLTSGDFSETKKMILLK